MAWDLNQRLGGRSEGPFWGFLSHPRKPRPYLWTEFRECEFQLKRRGLHPKPVFQLRGAGAVGAQSLLGVAAIARLRRILRARVWPFEPTAAADIVLAEVWPAFLGRPPASEQVPDRWQVVSLAAALKGVTLPQAPPAGRVEGWVLEPSLGAGNGQIR